MSAREKAASVREVRLEVQIDLLDAPELTNTVGRTRKPLGLRLSYGLRRDVTRLDITVEFQNSAELWPPAAEMPDWLAEIVEAHRPGDVDDPQSWRSTGMGGRAVGTETRGAVRPPLSRDPDPVIELNEVEQQLLAFALELASDQMATRDGFDDEGQAALDRLRTLTGEVSS